MPFNLPSGVDLKKQIVSLQDHSIELMHALLDAGFERKEILDFAKALGASPFSSVDRFLEYGSIFRPRAREIGCAAIAAALLIESHKFPSFRAFDWIETLFNALIPQFDEIPEGRLIIVTYNYDYSLEYFLYNGLTSSIEPKRAKAAFDKIRIIHLHGRLTPSHNPWKVFPPSKAAIQDSIDPHKGIKIIHELAPEDKQFTEARDAIRNAERVCFLGFGYDFVNLERLLKGINPDDFRSKFTCGSAFERTFTENYNVNRKFFNNNFQFGKKNWRIVKFLRESGVLQEFPRMRPNDNGIFTS